MKTITDKANDERERRRDGSHSLAFVKHPLKSVRNERNKIIFTSEQYPF
jgi:hypothetical protein